MKPEQYTDDAVCFAMGLGRFVPPAAEDIVRLVCRPSFHPEVCVTLTPNEIVVVALQSSLQREPSPSRMLELSERATLSGDELERICTAFDRALAESSRPPRRVVICDGMAVSAVRVRADKVERFSGHVVNEAEGQLVSAALALALSKTSSLPLRNRIAWCGRYVSSGDDRSWPIEPEPRLPQPLISRLLVLGAPEEREELHAMFGAKPARGSTT